MSDHHTGDQHADDRQDGIMPTETQIFPRPRTGAAERTRLDAQGLWSLADPTRVTAPPRVSPIGAHTVGAAAVTPPHGTPAVRPRTEQAGVLDALLDDRRSIAADTRRAWTGRPAPRPRRKARTVRDVAARRAAARLRHERHMEFLESARAYVWLGVALGVFAIVVIAGYVGFNILTGSYEWAPTHVR